MDRLTYRERALISRGYEEELVKNLNSFNEVDVNNVALNIFKKVSYNCSVTNNPKCIIVGGQPGSGKSTRINEINGVFNNNIIDINMDLYREYHPNYEWIVNSINKHWENREMNINDSPGNDLADFTHKFAGKVADKLVELSSTIINNQAYNIVIEWGMRKPDAPLETIKNIHDKGYYVEVIFIAVHKSESLEACDFRDTNKDVLVRRVSADFHDLCIKELPISAKTIYEEGFSNNIIDSFKIIDRDNNIIWDKDNNNDLYEVYYNYLNNN